MLVISVLIEIYAILPFGLISTAHCQHSVGKIFHIRRYILYNIVFYSVLPTPNGKIS